MKEYKIRTLTSSPFIAETETEPAQLNIEFDSKNTLVPEPSIIAPLCVDENEDGSITVVSDVSLLFDQQRISNMTPDNIRQMVNSMNPRVSPYTEKMSDDQLLGYIKARNIQSMSEMKAWSEYILSEYQQLEENLKQQIEESQPAVEEVSKQDGLD